MAGQYSQYAVDITTAAGGTATAYLPAPTELSRAPASAEVIAIIYTKDDYDAGVDFTITCSKSGLGVWTESNVDASKTVFPNAPACDQTGVAMLFAAAGEAVPSGPIPLANERLEIVIAAGGNAKVGNFRVILG